MTWGTTSSGRVSDTRETGGVAADGDVRGRVRREPRVGGGSRSIV
jgi:hypothetical protein